MSVMGKQREAVLDYIRSAGTAGITIRELTKATGLNRDGVVHSLLSEDLIYEETMPNGWVRYFWCGE